MNGFNILYVIKLISEFIPACIFHETQNQFQAVFKNSQNIRQCKPNKIRHLSSPYVHYWFTEFYQNEKITE